ncbi:hypothetical protein FOC1_g10004647 [Fusarium oxysporum f. sp. cubense race 1]|uniref:DUF6546 domain-containing protein n=1 Tax=Fusarium oxysporum f. sp. cubense (strain race 1) TaxID=1229664 RepID=N4TVZ1_FUSC1|nr:hypothetical protein FOC1_g10004647 [Fusarium oxysporum f. sp. cubense race 1]
MTRWNSLLQEIRGMILEYIVIHDRIAPYAPVSIEWRDAIEKTFRHLRIQASSSDACGRTPTVFESLSRLCGRHRRLVKHIWLNIEHTKHPKWWDSGYNLSSEDRAIGVAVKRLFQAVESWPAQNDLTLEINVYEPMSYSEEWLKGHHYEGPGEQNEDMRRLSTSEPRDLATAPRNALECLFDRLDFDMPSTPSVQAVTKFLLSLGYSLWILSWLHTDMFAGYAQHLLAASDSFNNFKSMTVFQDHNEYFNAVSRLHREELPRSHQATVVTPPVIPSRQPVLACLCLEHLSISFIIDSVDFFDQYREKWLWCELRSLTLTSQLLTCNGDSFKISGLLQTAAQMATRMPKLERLTICNGGVNEACAFTYRKHQHNASVTWQAKGGTQLHPAVHSAWENVHSRCFLSFESKGTWPIILSHAAAISCLGLEHVVSDVSLRQIQLENSITY